MPTVSSHLSRRGSLLPFLGDCLDWPANLRALASSFSCLRNGIGGSFWVVLSVWRVRVWRHGVCAIRAVRHVREWARLTRRKAASSCCEGVHAIICKTQVGVFQVGLSSCRSGLAGLIQEIDGLSTIDADLEAKKIITFVAPISSIFNSKCCGFSSLLPPPLPTLLFLDQSTNKESEVVYIRLQSRLLPVLNPGRVFVFILVRLLPFVNLF